MGNGRFCSWCHDQRLLGEEMGILAGCSSQAALSVPASLDGSYQGGCMLSFTQGSSIASVSHLSHARCPVLGRH